MKTGDLVQVKASSKLSNPFLEPTLQGVYGPSPWEVLAMHTDNIGLDKFEALYMPKVFARIATRGTPYAPSGPWTHVAARHLEVVGHV